MNKNQAILKNKLMPDSPNAEEDIVKSSVQLVHAAGMHARPAVKLTKLAKRFQSQIAMRVAGAADWIDGDRYDDRRPEHRRDDDHSRLQLDRIGGAGLRGPGCCQYYNLPLSGAPPKIVKKK